MKFVHAAQAGLGLLVTSGVLFAAAFPANAAEELYKGKTITLQIGLAAGGGYDIYSRVLARHYGRLIPGNPVVVPKNMPGAGGARAANYMYNVAPKDGSEISMIPASAIMLPVFGDPSAKFEPAKYTWLGSMNKEAASCGIWHTAGIASFDEMFQKEVIFGASGAGGITVQHAMVLKNLLGAKVKIISGYQGTKDVNLAMLRGEVHASCGLFVSTLQTQWRDEWRDGRLKILIQLGSQNHPAYKDTPNIFSYAKSDEDRQVLQLIFGQLDLGRPLLAPPDVPAAQRDVLRAALIATLRDTQFLEEAEKAQMEITPATAEEVDKLLAEFLSFPPSVVAKAKQAMGE